MARYIRILLVVLLFVALGVAAVWPVWTDPFNISLVGPGENDTRFLVWATFWGYHGLTTNPATLHTANIFHPEPYTYLYSDAPVSDAIIAAPWIAIFYHPEFTYNILILSMIVLGGLGMYLLARDLVLRTDAAVVAAIIYMFNPAHFGRLMQIHIFGDHWVPWFIWALLRWMRGYRKNDETEVPRYGWLWAALAALFYILNVLSGAHIAVFGTVIGLVVGLYYMLHDRLYRDKRFWFGLVAMAAAALIVLVPFFYPYVYIQDQMREQRVESNNDLQLGSAGLYELVSANSRFYNWLDTSSGWPGDLFQRQLRGYIFLGVIPLALGFIGLLRRKEKSKESPERSNTLAARALDIALVAVAWMAAISAIFGNTSFLLPLLRFPTPPSFALITAAVVLAVLRFILYPQQEHAAFALGRWLRLNLRPVADQWPWIILLLLGLLLALGPSGLLYTIFGKLPLINMIRVPRRFILVSSFALAVLCAYGIVKLIRGNSALQRFSIIGIVLALFAFEAAPEPVNVYPAEEAHPVYTWLGEQEGDFAVMEFPTAPREYGSFIRQVYGSIYHWKKLIIGYSGYQSKENRQLIYDLNKAFPGDACLDTLQDLDVRYVLVQRDRLDEERIAQLDAQSRLQHVESMGGVDIYRLTAAKSQ